MYACNASMAVVQNTEGFSKYGKIRGGVLSDFDATRSAKRKLKKRIFFRLVSFFRRGSSFVKDGKKFSAAVFYFASGLLPLPLRGRGRAAAAQRRRRRRAPLLLLLLVSTLLLLLLALLVTVEFLHRGGEGRRGDQRPRDSLRQRHGGSQRRRHAQRRRRRRRQLLGERPRRRRGRAWRHRGRGAQRGRKIRKRGRPGGSPASRCAYSSDYGGDLEPGEEAGRLLLGGGRAEVEVEKRGEEKRSLSECSLFLFFRLLSSNAFSTAK